MQELQLHLDFLRNMAVSFKGDPAALHAKLNIFCLKMEVLTYVSSMSGPCKGIHTPKRDSYMAKSGQ